jgi:hypothetical protein
MKGNHLPSGQFSPGGVDQRSPWVRRCKEQITEMLNDYGGHHNTSAAERSIVRRCAVITTELERLEYKFATADQATAADLDLYIRGCGTLRRLLESVGLQRRPRNVTPNLANYLRSGNQDDNVIDEAAE